LRELKVDSTELLRVFEFEPAFLEKEQHLIPVFGVGVTPASPGTAHWFGGRAGVGAGPNALWTAQLRADSPLRLWVSEFGETKRDFLASLRNEERRALAKVFSGQPVAELPGLEIPAPTADRLVFSSQGSWFDVRASRPQRSGTTLLRGWTHSVGQGHDQAAEVIYDFWVYPDGIPVQVVRQTTRELERESFKGGTVGAFLKKRLLLRPLPESRLSREELVETPFTSLAIPAEGIPLLDLSKTNADFPDESGGAYVIPPPAGAENPLPLIAFWPRVGGENLRLRIKVQDHAGNPREIWREVILVGDGLLDEGPPRRIKTASDQDALDKAWESRTEARTVALGGDPWAIAPEVASRDTTLSVSTIDTVRGPHLSPVRPFTARVHALKSRVDIASALAGTNLETAFTYRTLSKTPLEVRLAPPPLLEPLTAKNGAFIRVHGEASAGLEISGDAKKGIGAISSPSVSIAGIGHDQGLVLGPPELPAAPKLTDIFPETSQLLGAFSLSQILGLGTSLPAWEFKSGQAPEGYVPNAPTNAPLGKLVDVEAVIDGWEASLGWQSEKFSTNGLFVANVPAGRTTELALKAEMGATRSTGSVKWGSRATLTNFAIRFPGTDPSFIRVRFDWLRFDAGSDRPTSVECKVGGVEFDALLKLLEKLSSLLGIPPELKVNVQPDAVDVEYETRKDKPFDVLNFTISSLAIRTGMSLSLKGLPLAVIFALNSKQRPFLISSVEGYAGGGFIECRSSSKGIESFSAAFELGWRQERDFSGVAHGEVSLMAGFYFRTGSAVPALFEGYVRFQGHLSVVAIGGIDIFAYLGLRWQAPSTFIGSAEVRVTVTIGPFDVSQSFTAEWQFSQGKAAQDEALFLSQGSNFCEVCP